MGGAENIWEPLSSIVFVPQYLELDFVDRQSPLIIMQDRTPTFIISSMSSTFGVQAILQTFINAQEFGLGVKETLTKYIKSILSLYFL